jgi:hypothetical protein
MKKNRFQIIALSALLFHLSWGEMQAQTNSFIIESPDPTLTAQCPGVEFTYKIRPRNSCYSVEVVGAEGSPTITAITENGVQKWQVVLKWKDEPVFGKITVKRDTSAACSGNTPEQRVFDIPILSVANKFPLLLGDFNVPAGKLVELEYETDLNYEVSGPSDPNPFEATYFEWKMPTGWNFIGTNPNGKKYKVLTDNCTGGDVEVRGRSVCGKWSNWEKLPVSRVVETPCPVTSSRPYVVCGDQTAIAINATPDVGFTGYTYEWEKPANWTWDGGAPGSQSSSVNVKPDGLSGGTVRVRAVACGLKSAWCSVSLPLKKIDPETRIKGTDTLCSIGTQSLTITPHAASTVTWNLTPTAAFSPHAGTGTSASLNLTSNTFGDSVTITFKIATPCGDTTMAKRFFAGKPKLFDQRIDGVLTNMAWVCPGTHTASLKLRGANSLCASWENSGNNAYFLGCLESNTYISGYSGSTAFIARATNVCGTADTKFFIVPDIWTPRCNEKEWSMRTYPNPAVGQVTVETYLPEGSTLTEAPTMQGIKIVNGMGNIIYQSTQAGTLFNIPLSGVAPGTYTLQSMVNGAPVSEIIQINPN